jgi:hypothetical protein
MSAEPSVLHIPSQCSSPDCKGKPVSAHLNPMLKCWVSRCRRHIGKDIHLDFNRVISAKEARRRCR